MSDFAAAAVRLSGTAAVLLGWTPDTFWAATPAELEAVLMALAGASTGIGAEMMAAGPPDAATITRLMEQFPDG